MENDPHSRWNCEITSHLDWLRCVVQSRLHESDRVDDLVHDVVADALAVKDPANQIVNPGPWLYRLAIRKVLLFRRSQGRQRRAMTRLKELQEVSGARQVDSPLETMLADDRGKAIRDALAQLNGRDVEILNLKYAHGWSYEQISKTLGINNGKVVYRLRIARDRLRAQLLVDNRLNSDLE